MSYYRVGRYTKGRYELNNSVIPTSPELTVRPLYSYTSRFSSFISPLYTDGDNVGLYRWDDVKPLDYPSVREIVYLWISNNSFCNIVQVDDDTGLGYNTLASVRFSSGSTRGTRTYGDFQCLPVATDVEVRAAFFMDSDGNIRIADTEHRFIYKSFVNNSEVYIASDVLLDSLPFEYPNEYLGEYAAIRIAPEIPHRNWEIVDNLPEISSITISPLNPVLTPEERLYFEVVPNPDVPTYIKAILDKNLGETTIFVEEVGYSVRYDAPNYNSPDVERITFICGNKSEATNIYLGYSSPYDNGGTSSPSGGGGNFGDDRVSDDIIQLIPEGSAANSLTDAGIFSHYLVTARQLKGLGEWLFSDNIGDVLKKELVELWFGNTFDSIISLMSYPFAINQLPSITTKASNIYLGHFDTEAPSSGLLTNDVTQIDWGTISITEYWGNFLDYAPHTKIQLYLPWSSGFVDIDPNECMQGSLNVKTNIELTKGTCVHIVSNGNGAVIGTFNGFCGAQYPITSKDTSGKAITTVVTAVAAAATAGSAALGAGASSSARIAGANSVQGNALLGESVTAAQTRAGIEAAARASAPYNAVTSGASRTAAVSSLAAARMPVNFPRNGSFSPNSAHLAIQVPYIIMTWPDQSVPEQYGSHVGYPSNIYYSLGRLVGYTEVGAIHLEGINCTEHEREELLGLLQGGVIL